MSIQKNILTLILCLWLAVLIGCFKIPSNEGLTLTQAQEKFTSICLEEYDLDVKVKSLSNTFWIYLPLKEDIFSLKLKKEKTPSSDKPTETPVIKYLDVAYLHPYFEIKYDIASIKSYPLDLGYETGATEKFSDVQRKVVSALSRAFSDVKKSPEKNKFFEKVPGDIDFSDPKRDMTHGKLVQSYVKPPKAPDFFVIVIADTVNGFEIESILSFADIYRVMRDDTFKEEYVRRVVVEYPKGNPDAIGDITGTHINFRNLTWPDFLSRQIISRMRFKYTLSDFPPSKNTEEEILKIAAHTLSGYEFKGFSGINLFDLGNEKNYSVSASELQRYK